jgi:uncharacterized membrane protein SirB2
MDYPTIKIIHIASVAASYSLFWLRGVWMMRDPLRLQAKWVNVVPHAIDTVLLASAIALAVLLRQYPLQAPWLTAKVSGLLAYIVLGTVALKRGRSRGMRVAAWIAAHAVFIYIVSVAVTKRPWPLG